MLQQDEWLQQAKRLAVGMRQRVRHGRERRANMTIGHERGHYWAYCQACKEAGKVSKDHVLRMPAEPLDEAQELTVPADLRPVVGGPYEDAVGRFLASKGMMFPYLPKLWYSERARRLCLQDGLGQWHGRDLTDKSAAKWLHYGKPASACAACMYTARVAVVTEDVFSMFKVEYAIRPAASKLEVVSTLGAGCSVKAALAFKNYTTIVWAYDGDRAGDAGFAQGSKRMRVHVPRQLRARPPEGMDPKDMKCEDIRKMIMEVLG